MKWSFKCDLHLLRSPLKRIQVSVIRPVAAETWSGGGGGAACRAGNKKAILDGEE